MRCIVQERGNVKRLSSRDRHGYCGEVGIADSVVAIRKSVFVAALQLAIDLRAQRLIAVKAIVVKALCREGASLLVKRRRRRRRQ